MVAVAGLSTMVRIAIVENTIPRRRCARLHRRESALLAAGAVSLHVSSIIWVIVAFGTARCKPRERRCRGGNSSPGSLRPTYVSCQALTEVYDPPVALQYGDVTADSKLHPPDCQEYAFPGIVEDVAAPNHQHVAVA